MKQVSTKWNKQNDMEKEGVRAKRKDEAQEKNEEDSKKYCQALTALAHNFGLNWWF